MTGKVANVSSYAGGFSGGLIDRGMSVAMSHPGKVFWVSDTGLAAFPNRKTPSNGNKGTFMDPFATIHYASTQCTADRGDIIMVMPGHTETITAAAGLALAVAGVRVIGQGDYTNKPVILMDAAAATIAVTADNVGLYNVNVKAGFADVVTAITTTAKGTTIGGVVFDDNAVAENFLIPISQTGADNTSDGLRVLGCQWSSVDALSTEFIALANTVADLVVDDNYVVHEGTLTAQLIKGVAGAAIQRGRVTNNFLSHKMTAAELFMDIDTASTGIIAHNRVRHADVTTTHDLGINGIGMGLFDNLSASTDAVSGVVLPAIDVNS